MDRLSVIYDATCGMCRRLKNWIAREPAFVELEFIPLQDAALETQFPGILNLHPEREIVVISDKGEVYQGGKAWVMCLWALKDYREWAQRLANPLLLPLAKKTCTMVSRNRYAISRWFFEAPPEEVSQRLDRMPDEDCESGSCNSRLSS